MVGFANAIKSRRCSIRVWSIWPLKMLSGNFFDMRLNQIASTFARIDKPLILIVSEDHQQAGLREEASFF